MSPTIETPEVQDLSANNTAWIQKAQAALVRNHDEADSANVLLRDVKALQKEIKGRFEPAVAAANKAHKELTALRGSLLDPLERAESVLKQRLGDYVLEERRKAEAERRRLEEDARMKAEEERLARAASLERQGRHMEAQAEVDAPIVSPAIPEPPAPPKVAGLATTEKWVARVDNLLALVRHIAANPELIGLVKADQSALDSMARANKGALSLPGISPVCSAQVAVR